MRNVVLLCVFGVIAGLIALNWAQVMVLFDSATPRSEPVAQSGGTTAVSELAAVDANAHSNEASAVPKASDEPSNASNTTATASATTSATQDKLATVARAPKATAPDRAQAIAEDIAKAPLEVLEKAPAELLAQTLAATSAQATSELSPATLTSISKALVMAQTPPKETVVLAAASAAQSQLAATPVAPARRTTATGSVITALAPPPQPLALGTTAIVPPTTTLSNRSSTSAPDPHKTLTGSSAQALAKVPRQLLAQALSELSAATLKPALTADLQSKLPAALTRAESDLRLDSEARAFIDALTPPVLTPIKVGAADHFVRPAQRLNLIAQPTRRTQTVAALELAGVADDAPISVLRISHQLEPLRAARFEHSTPSELKAPINILEHEKIVQIELGEALRRIQLQPLEPVTIVNQVEYLEPTTIAELRRAGELDGVYMPRVVAQPYGISQQTLEQILGAHQAEDPDAIYYIRTVQSSDVQGIWGIIQHGLIENFAKGMAIRRGTSANTFRVDIPRLADEPLANRRGSSFLGRMLFHKSKRSTLYNIRLGKIADRPETIMAGQQIVIIDFSPRELLQIYRHFIRLAARQKRAS